MELSKSSPQFLPPHIEGGLMQVELPIKRELGAVTLDFLEPDEANAFSVPRGEIDLKLSPKARRRKAISDRKAAGTYEPVPPPIPNRPMRLR